MYRTHYSHYACPPDRVSACKPHATPTMKIRRMYLTTLQAFSSKEGHWTVFVISEQFQKLKKVDEEMSKDCRKGSFKSRIL